MRDNYDFSDAVKNPFANRIKGKYTVTIHYDFTDKDESAEDTCLDERADKDTPEQRQV